VVNRLPGRAVLLCPIVTANDDNACPRSIGGARQGGQFDVECVEFAHGCLGATATGGAEFGFTPRRFASCSLAAQPTLNWYKLLLSMFIVKSCS
jgi:hypothetical protein